MNLSRYTLLDLETVALDDAAQWLPKIEAPGNYSKPETIEAYVKGETMKALDRASLDPDCCRIVAMGMGNRDGRDHVWLVDSDIGERTALEQVWDTLLVTQHLVGYGLTWFDLGVLVRRSQILGVHVPPVIYKQGKYRHDWIVELADYLTLNGMIDQKKGRGLDYHCRRLGIQVEDAHAGKDVAQLWKDGNTDAILAHCAADLTRVRLLAERLGVIQPVPVPEAEEAQVF